MPLVLPKISSLVRSIRSSLVAVLLMAVSVSAHATSLEFPASEGEEFLEPPLPRLQLSMGEANGVSRGETTPSVPNETETSEALIMLLRAFTEQMSHTQALIHGRPQRPLFLKERVRVAIYSVNGERVTLQTQRHVTISKDAIILRKTARSYEDFCTTPCHLEVTAGDYRFAVADAESWRKPRTFEVRRRVNIRQDTELWLKRKSRRPARASFYAAMAASVIAGLTVGIVSAIEQRDGSLSLSPSRGPLMGALSGGLVLAGAGFFAGGMLSRDTFEVSPKPYRPPEEKSDETSHLQNTK